MNNRISEWNTVLNQPINTDLIWLRQFKDQIKRIINFGCWRSSEPFVLLWYMDGQEIVVIEIDYKNLNSPNNYCPIEVKEVLEKKYPDSLQGRRMDFINADMVSTPIKENYFDIAFCKDVLYFMQENQEKVRKAISEMVRVIKPGGYIVAIEEKYGLDRNNPDSKLQREPKDISDFFNGFSLERVSLDPLPEFPEFNYCYKKL